MSDRVIAPKVYAVTFAALLGLLALTIGTASMDLGSLSFPVALGIAFAKGALIVLFFMHVRFSGRLIWLAAAGGFIWLFIMLALMLADYKTRSSADQGGRTDREIVPTSVFKPLPSR